MATIPDSDIENFGGRLSHKGSIHFDTPVRLRGQELSYWYFDARHALSAGPDLQKAASYLLYIAEKQDITFEVVAGMGVAGTALATAVAMESDKELVQGNDSADPNQRYSKGLHGASVHERNVLVVDDTATTGNSLITLIDMVREEGGLVSDALTLADRSNGLVAASLAQKGVNFWTVYDFIEQKGVLRPSVGIIED